MTLYKFRIIIIAIIIIIIVIIIIIIITLFPWTQLQSVISQWPIALATLF